MKIWKSNSIRIGRLEKGMKETDAAIARLINEEIVPMRTTANKLLRRVAELAAEIASVNEALESVTASIKPETDVPYNQRVLDEWINGEDSDR